MNNRATNGFVSAPKWVGGVDGGRVQRKKVKLEARDLRKSREKASDEVGFDK